MKKAAKKSHKTNISIDDYPLGERIRYIRTTRSLSQQELADSAGVSQSTVAQIESENKDPSVSTLKKIAKALDVEVAILFAKDDVCVFNMTKLKKNYKDPDSLTPAIYMAIGKVIRYAKSIGYID